MKSTTSQVALYQLSYSQLKTYLIATLFVVGNIALPQLCHLIPQGGLIFLPIYFFFGMPPAAMLPIILIKSVTLAAAAALIAKKSGKVSLLTVAMAVIAYQLIGSLAEWAMTGSIEAASQDIILGWPGCLIQIVGGYVMLRYLLKK